ncbi:acyltransferase family protein [Kitasatospora sp. NPDC059827]|uniref:acyltransferase family protein n=1 Tax=Kitasatospora sp. NPDC059827 TaxID=3346964 RepID=UPI00365C4339
MALGRSSRLPSLSGLRFVAAAAVVAQHASLVWTHGHGESATLLRLGFAAVTFFFLLSGFLLTWAWRPGQPVPVFWRRRVARILPTHLVTLLIGVLLLAATGRAVPLWAWLPNALLVQTWSPGFDLLDPGVNGVSWSLCCDLLFYLLFPVIARRAAAIRSAHLWAWAAAAVAAAVLIPVVLTAARPGSGGPSFGLGVTLRQIWLCYTFPPARLPEFLFGVVLARLVREGRLDGVRTWHGAAAFALLYPLDQLSPLLFGVAAITVLPLGALIVGAANADRLGRPSRLAHPAAERLGALSLTLYLSHYLVIEYGDALLDPYGTADGLRPLLYTAVLVAGSLAAAWLLHALVEEPSVRALNEPRRRTAPVTLPDRPKETS